MTNKELNNIMQEWKKENKCLYPLTIKIKNSFLVSKIIFPDIEKIKIEYKKMFILLKIHPFFFKAERFLIGGGSSLTAKELKQSLCMAYSSFTRRIREELYIYFSEYGQEWSGDEVVKIAMSEIDKRMIERVKKQRSELK